MERIVSGLDFIPEHDEWEERFSKERLKEDNEFLKEQLGVDEQQYFVASRTTPELENLFLRNIKEFEEADKLPKRSVRSLLPDGFELPSADRLTRSDLGRKLDQILSILEDHGISLDLVGKVPNAVVYNYLIQGGLDDEIPLELPEGFHYHIDGCDGYCPQCFQRPYCETGKDPWPEDDTDKNRSADSV